MLIGIAGFEVRYQLRNPVFWVSIAIFFLLPVMGLFAYLTWPFFWNMWVTGEMSGNIGGLVRWPAALLMPVGFAAMFLQGVAEIIKRIAYLRGLITMDTHYEKPVQ